MNERASNAPTVWRAAPTTQALVWVFIGVAIAALPLLAATLWMRGANRYVATGLLVLTVAAVVYGWRFGVHPRMAVAGEHLVIRNPLRTIRVPLDRVTDVEPGENGLRVTTSDAAHEVWCVQKSSASIRTGRRGRADLVADELRRHVDAARTAPAVPVEPPLDPPEDATLPDDPVADDLTEDDLPELLIHRASGADATTLARLEQQASTEALADVFPPAEHPYPLAEVEGRWAERLADRSVRVRLAELDSEPVGYLAYRDNQILHLGVLPEHQGQGYGRQLVDYAAADVRRRHDQLVLWVLRDNQRARRFYRAYGFVDTVEERRCEFPPRPTEIKLVLGLHR